MGLLGAQLIRPWAIAEDPAPRPDATSAGPAPFAVDHQAREDVYLSHTKRALADGWSRWKTEAGATAAPAGRPPPEYPGHAVEAVHRAGWDAPDWKALQTKYTTDHDEEALARAHRRNVHNRALSKDERESRWIECFSQWAGGASPGRGAQARRQRCRSQVPSAVATDFSMLPAGYHPQKKSARAKRPPAPPHAVAGSVVGSHAEGGGGSRIGSAAGMAADFDFDKVGRAASAAGSSACSSYARASSDAPSALRWSRPSPAGLPPSFASGASRASGASGARGSIVGGSGSEATRSTGTGASSGASRPGLPPSDYGSHAWATLAPHSAR